MLLDESDHRTRENNFFKSDALAKYALFPILSLETIIYITMNIFLLWIWYKSGEFVTIVNKLIGIQRLFGILYSFGCLLDYFYRVYGTSVSSDWQAFICSCWMIYYKLLVYGFHTSHLGIALVRFFCVKYPIEYHIRSEMFEYNFCHLKYFQGAKYWIKTNPLYQNVGHYWYNFNCHHGAWSGLNTQNDKVWPFVT